MTEFSRRCELCNEESTVYCPADSAFLCTTCDENVHRANFLVARHGRVRVCSHCRNLAGTPFYGVGVYSPGIAKVTCESCSPHVDDDGDCLSSSSSCVSSTCSSVSSTRKMKSRGETAVDMKVEGVLVNWCRRLGVDDKRVVKMTVGLLNGCVGKMPVWPFRVLIATVFWVAVRICCGGFEVARIEQISGVPSKLILATESRLARVLKSTWSREDGMEGWGEC